MTDTPRAYQEAGIAWIAETLNDCGAALLADEPGLGKTLQAIRAAQAAATAKNGFASAPAAVVIICPAIVVPHHWQQLERWGAITVERHPRRRGCAWRGRVGHGADDSEWLVYSYEGFAAAVAAQQKGAAPGKTARWLPLPERCAFLVLDEIHALMSERSKRSKAAAAALQAWHPRPLVLGLSGTPMTARPRDLWNPLTLLFGRRVVGSFFSFTKAFCAGYWRDIEGLDRPVWDSSGTSNPEALAALLKPLMLRRTKAEVLTELPPVTRVVHEVELPAAAQKAAMEAARMAQEALQDADSSGGWGDSGERSERTSGGPSRALARLLSGLEEHKLSAAEELARELVAEGSRPLLLTTRIESARTLGERLCCPWVCGEVPTERRRDALLGSDVLSPGVATLYSLTTGIDLVEYDCVVYVGLDWVPSTLEQALARLHRLGQKRSVVAHYLVALGTLDEVVRDRVIARLEIFAAVVGGEQEAALAQTLRGGSEEDLLAAFIEAARSNEE